MINQQDFVAASMRLFNCVLSAEADAASADSFSVIKDYGVVVSPSAAHFSREIESYLKVNAVSDRQLNQTFYSSPSEVEGKTLFERLSDQLTHYFSTYGLRALGIDSEFMYIPHNWEQLNLPERVKFQVIVGASSQELTERSLQMLASGVALKQETIEDILTVLTGCSYRLTGEEVVKNKEARIIIADRTGVLPKNGEDLFRYLFFKVTGSSLVINNSRVLDQIRFSGYALPPLDDTQIAQLAKSFNRRKPYWMAFKMANKKANGSVVNRIAKLSKKVHTPISVDVLGNLTSQSFTPAEVEKAIADANTFRLIRAYNALKQYAHLGKNPVFHRVRNGKGFVRYPKERQVDLTSLAVLREAISARINTKAKVYIPEGLVYALPTSEKQFSTNIPNFSYVEVDPQERDLLVGIYWENSPHRTDFDLSCNSLGGDRIGWNGRWNNTSLVYSGDITNAPNGAAEWFAVRSLAEPWLVTVNLYSGPSEAPFKIMVGYGNNKDGNYRNYFIDPNDVLFVADSKAIQGQMTLGAISPLADGKVRFTLVNQGGSNRHVSAPGGLTTSTIGALLTQTDTAATLNEFVTLCDSPEEADIDLSPDKVGKDTLLSLYS